LVNMEVLQVIREGCKGMLLDMFGTFVNPLESNRTTEWAAFPMSARARTITTA
jgi:hypothetical protein